MVATRKFTVILPLVVWSELKGLRRGQLRHRPVDAPEDDYDPAQRAHVQKGIFSCASARCGTHLL